MEKGFSPEKYYFWFTHFSLYFSGILGRSTLTVDYLRPTSSICHLRTADVEITSVKSSIMFSPLNRPFRLSMDHQKRDAEKA